MLLTDVNYASLRQTSTFFSPGKVIFGVGFRKDLAKEIGQLGGSRILIVTHPEAAASAIIQEITKVIHSSGIDFAMHSRTEPEPRIELAEDLAAYTRGGGSTLLSVRVEVALWISPRSHR